MFGFGVNMGGGSNYISILGVKEEVFVNNNGGATFV